MTALDIYLDKFSASGKRILQAALDDAHRRHQQYVFPEHILSALISKESQVFNEILHDLSIDPKAFQSAVEKRLEFSPVHAGTGFRVSDETAKLLKYSFNKARSEGRTVIDAKDICDVLSGDKRSLLDDILQNPENVIPIRREKSRI